MSTPVTSTGRNFWPAGLVAAFVIFIGGTAALIVLSARTSTDLVSPDYYERELRFQEDINRRARVQALAGPVRVSYDDGQRSLTLELPVAHAAGQAQGEILLYRPAAAREDRRVALQLDAQGRQMFDARALSDGLWRVRVTWRVNGEDFACDEKVVIGQLKSS